MAGCGCNSLAIRFLAGLDSDGGTTYLFVEIL
jgi:hypothetical protein